MKIAIVNQPPGVLDRNKLSGSISILSYRIAHGLSKRFDCIIYAAKGKDQPGAENDEGILYRRFEVNGDRLVVRAVERLYRILPKQWPAFNSLFYYCFFILRVALDIRRQKCDAVHVQNYSHFVPWLRLLNPGVRIILHMSCDWLAQLNKTTVQRRLAQVDCVVGCSNHVTDLVKQRFPQFAQRCRTVLNGIDVFERACKNGSRQAAPDSRRVLFVGRISPEKGIHVLLDAFRKILAEVPQAELVIIGPKRQLLPDYIVSISQDEHIKQLRTFYNGSSRRAYYEYLLARTHELGVADNVHFTGGLSGAELIQYYLSAEILVQPSYTDALPLTVIESMAHGLPVVASQIGGIPELVDEQTGILVAVDDPDALASAVVSLLNDGDRRARMSRAARARVEQEFSWEVITPEWVRLYETMAAGS